MVFKRRHLFCALAVGLVASATAAQSFQQGSAGVTIARPVSITKLADLDFGDYSVTSAGTAVLDPNTDTVVVAGGVTRSGGTPHSARFRVSASRFALIFIQIPATSLTLTKVGGTETMTVSNWTMTGFPIRLIDAQNSVDFGVGGTLNVGNTQAQGTYTGTLTVTVDYF